MFQLPLDFLIHSISYSQFNGKNLDGDDDYSLPITINYVRVDMTPVFSRDSNQSKLTANGVIYIDGVNSSGLPDKFLEQSKIAFDGTDLIVTKAIPCYQPNVNSIHHWEIEVV